MPESPRAITSPNTQALCVVAGGSSSALWSAHGWGCNFIRRSLLGTRRGWPIVPPRAPPAVLRGPAGEGITRGLQSLGAYTVDVGQAMPDTDGRKGAVRIGELHA